ncbi:MAG TPA: hypothetical protein VF899_09275 [Pyrinomonadaceae bacterium]
MIAPRTLKRFTAFPLLVSLCSALLVFDYNKAQAAVTSTTAVDQVSPDLRRLIQSGTVTPP